MRRASSPIVTRSFAATCTTPRPSAPVPPRVVSTAAPTPQYRRHHDVSAPQVDSISFRQSWRVSTRLDNLLEAGRIDREAWDCAQEWRRWAELICLSHVQRWDVRPDTPCHPSDLPMLRRVEAAAKLRACAEALGELRIRLLDCCVARDLSWREIATLLRVSDKTATVWVIEALFALADWRCGRTVAPPPVIRFRNQPGSL
jgi:hypothetical protein